MAADYSDGTTAGLLGFLHIENSAGLLKCNGTEHLVKKKYPQPCMVFLFMDDIYCFCILIVCFQSQLKCKG